MVEEHGKIRPLIGNKFIQGIAKDHRYDICLFLLRYEVAPDKVKEVYNANKIA